MSDHQEALKHAIEIRHLDVYWPLGLRKIDATADTEPDV